MERFLEIHCWVRHLKPQVAEQLASQADSGFAKALDRPPTKTTLLVGDLQPDDEPSNQTGHIPAASQTYGLALALSADMAFRGNPKGYVLDYRLVLGDRSAAYDLLRTEPAWFNVAERYFLLHLNVDAGILPRKPAIQPLPSSNGFSSYEERWSVDFRRQASESCYFTGRDWESIDLNSHLQPSHGEQCTTVKTEQRASWGTEEAQARKEHLGGWHAIMPVLEACGLGDIFSNPTAMRAVIELIGRTMEEALPPLAYFKEKFNIARPTQGTACSDVNWKLSVPKHPSFPGGHATQARLVARVAMAIIAPTPPINDPLFAANQIAKRREYAGLHFPMDTSAGQALADELFNLMQGSSAYQSLLTAARAEV